MIGSFRHRGLKRLYERGDTGRVRADQVRRIRRILARLDDAEEVAHMDLPGLRLHALNGDLKGFWAVTVSGNWRVVFRFEDGAAHDVDLIDYH